MTKDPQQLSSTPRILILLGKDDRVVKRTEILVKRHEFKFQL